MGGKERDAHQFCQIQTYADLEGKHNDELYIWVSGLLSVDDKENLGVVISSSVKTSIQTVKHFESARIVRGATRRSFDNLCTSVFSSIYAFNVLLRMKQSEPGIFPRKDTARRIWKVCNDIPHGSLTDFMGSATKAS